MSEDEGFCEEGTLYNQILQGAGRMMDRAVASREREAQLRAAIREHYITCWGKCEQDRALYRATLTEEDRAIIKADPRFPELLERLLHGGESWDRGEWEFDWGRKEKAE